MFDIRSLGRKWKIRPHSSECGLTVSVLAAVLLHRGPGRYSVRDRVVIITGGSTGLDLALAREVVRPWSAACAARPRWRRSSSGQLQTLRFRSPSNDLAR